MEQKLPMQLLSYLIQLRRADAVQNFKNCWYHREGVIYEMQQVFRVIAEEFYQISTRSTFKISLLRKPELPLKYISHIKKKTDFFPR